METDRDKLRRILEGSKSIAVVGLSADPSKDSFRVADYLREKGYKVFGVSPNPKLKEVWPLSTTRLSEIGDSIDIVDLFLRPESVEPVVDEAIARKAKVVWMQSGISHEAAAAKARSAGLEVVMDTCIRAAHTLLLGKPAGS